jgi:FKBP-type peptidyl-prolyl cis-trans isomerase FklB
MKKTILMAALLTAGLSGFSQTLKTHEDSVSYALGVSMAESLKKSGITNYNEALFMQAVQAQLKGKGTMEPTVADKVYRDEQKKIADAKSAMAKKAGEEFLAANKSKPGVVTTASGLQYKVTKEGTGASPSKTDKVTVHYHGTLPDGTIFDSSVDRGTPATFGLNQVIAGWTEGLQLMKEGGKTTFYIPQALGYGARGQGKIPAFSTLIFDVELIKIEPPAEVTPKPGQPVPPAPPAPPKPPAPQAKPAVVPGKK